MKRVTFLGVVIICIISLSACGKRDLTSHIQYLISHIQGTGNNISENQQSDDSIEEELSTPVPMEVEKEVPMSQGLMEPERTPLLSGSESADGYFFPQGVDSCVYMAAFADFWPQQKENEVVMYITEVQVFEEGTLYDLKIDSNVEAPDTHAGYRGDWRNFGLFYVQGDEIYFIRAEEAKSEYQTVEEILCAGTLVCSEAGEEDALGEDERGWHEFILVDGNRREYHGYSTLVETGYYEHFYWEKGKGLVTYESGYGALADGIEMYLVE